MRADKANILKLIGGQKVRNGMKKIIKGKVYDTDTAKQVGSCWWNDAPTGDFASVNETLFVKKTGEYFLDGEGGPMTKYAVRDGSNWSSGQELIPLAIEEAREWAEEKLTADEYESEFGAIVEDDSKKVVSMYLALSTVERLKRMAAERGTSIGDVVEQSIALSQATEIKKKEI